jgi:hypothetical protein
MTRWMVLLALAPACGFSSPSGPPIIDAMPDVPPPDASLCYGAIVHVCFDSPAVIPGTPKNLTDDKDIDTDSLDPAMCNQDNDHKMTYCVFAGAGFSLTMGKKITAHGGKPLVLLSTQRMDLAGDVDVSSNHNGLQRKGPGANPTAAGACTFLVIASMNAGAAGGTFGNPGGLGSDAVPTSGVQGRPGSPISGFPMTLRGGCPGGDSAVVDAAGAGHGGDGGGAIAILGAPIQINGNINASGSGGHGALGGPGATAQGGGGGGGGSGGMIVLDSPMKLSLGMKARIWANGGGGAQGGAPLLGGTDGNESAGPAMAAAATMSSTIGGNGGAGSFGSSGGANGVGDAMDKGGGGGGGGGAGVIHAPGVSEPMVVSPPPTSP